MSQTTTTAAPEILSAGIIICVIQDVLKRWTIIFMAALLAAMLAFMYTDLTYKPQYAVTTTFVVTAGSTSATTYQNLNAAANTASIFTEVLNSSLLRQKVQEQTDISGFDGTISASAVGDTNLLNMTVRGSDPRTVFLMSRAVIEHHHIVSADVLGSTVLEVLRAPQVPTSPVNPPDKKNTAVTAAFLAAVAAAGILAVHSFLADRVRSRDEADAKLTCRVLGELYHERKRKTLRSVLDRRKKSLLITDPLTSFSYTESVYKLSSRVDKCRHRGEHIIMVTSLLENEGKSTVAVNLALSMVKKGKKVLLIDCDLRKPACAVILGADPDAPGTVDVLQGRQTLKECVQHLENIGLYLLSGRRSLRTATALVNSAAMDTLLVDAAQEYDLIIIDTPPMSAAPDAESISDNVDASLLVVRQNEAPSGALNDAVAILDKSSSHLLGCVLNNVCGSGSFIPAFSYSYYGRYGKYGKYGKYGSYDRYGEVPRSEAGSEEMKSNES